ncbi:MAG: IS200/IS605 family transposase [Ignavibacteriales bacterium]|nr:MAG: IS200/IS605 family transposase [Ignavibacteriales bacterium]
MSLISVYIHIVWSTKFREKFLDTPELRTAVWNHILCNARAKEIHLDHVNGYSEHCHCLVSLKPTQNISEIVRLIKGESSRWINEQKLVKGHFRWQEEYFAASVAQDHLDRVRKYIQNQEIHHTRETFDAEYDRFIKYHGFQGSENL